jgi:hypothetical protein
VNRSDRLRASRTTEARNDGPHRSEGGRTNAEALAELSLSLNGLPQPGRVYRVEVREAPDGRNAELVGEFDGFVQDRPFGPDTHAEIALSFTLVDRGEGAGGAGAEEPTIVWPLDIDRIAQLDGPDRSTGCRCRGRRGPAGTR